ncbi:hypothetical protein FALBO_5696 [Fusarium albosuccineum]|uniref:Uncharacterized protein n=1 Tax=Fusarium albosuccineum TaxID=1237068 RepID=A0A8H4LGY9_9HYPO|nr:hypothetical protein FALBO_5696 [Fusarium albosuccineum]KAF5007964.1 hypothetical protein FDECE_5733 [Fusarium decemcellulare]
MASSLPRPLPTVADASGHSTETCGTAWPLEPIDREPSLMSAGNTLTLFSCDPISPAYSNIASDTVGWRAATVVDTAAGLIARWSYSPGPPPISNVTN